VRRGEAADSPLTVSPKVVALKQLREDLASAPWTKQFLGNPKVSLVNPKIELKNFDDDSQVSFIPMEAVEENVNKVKLTNRLLNDVRRGYTAFANGDLLWAKITPCMQNGKTALVDGLTNGVGFGSTEFHVIRAQKHVLNGYLWALLSMPRLLYAAQAAFTGSSGHQRVPASFLETLEIPVPPLVVQKRLIKDLDNALSERNRSLCEADRLLSSIDEMVKKKLGLPNIEELKHAGYAIKLGDVKYSNTLSADYFHPERVRSVKMIKRLYNAPLSQLVSFQKNRINTPGDSRYLGLASVESNTGQLIDTIETAGGQCSSFQVGDVLYGRLRPYLNKVWLATFEGVCSTEFHVMRSLDVKKLRPEYLAVVMRTNLIVAQTKHMMTGNTHPRIANEDVANLLIPLASPDTQKAIVDETLSRQAESARLRDHAEKVWREAREVFEKQLFVGDEI
jgi:type I restriction enzyme S subunit